MKLFMDDLSGAFMARGLAVPAAAGALLHTVEFSTSITFIDASGVSFKNLSTTEVTTNVTAASVSPGLLLAYNVTWVNDPRGGEPIQFQYANVSGNYEDTSDGIPLLDQSLLMENCLDVFLLSNSNRVTSNGGGIVLRNLGRVLGISGDIVDINGYGVKL